MSLKRGSFKLFRGGSSDEVNIRKGHLSGAKTLTNLQKSSSYNGIGAGHQTVSMSTLSKSSSYSAYPNKGSRTFSAAKRNRIIRRNSFDLSDIKGMNEPISPDITPQGGKRRPSEEMRRRFNRSRTLPSLSSWDLYGEEAINVSFHKRKSTSFPNISDQLRAYAEEEEKKKHQQIEKIRQEDVIYGVINEKLHILSATKEKLLKKLVDPVTEPEYLHQYIETHIWHSSPSELFQKLVELYNPTIQGDDLKILRLRIIGIVVHWLDSFPSDFTDLQEDLTNFIEIVTKTGMPPRLLNEVRAGGISIAAAQGNPPSPKLPKMKDGDDKLQFLDFHPTEVARQLTLLEHARFREIDRKELLRQAWNKSNSEVNAPRLVSYIKRFNQVSYWVATEVVFTPNVKQRVMVLKHMIQIAHKLLQCNNFHCALQIVAGLNMSSVQRLKKTWKGLSSKYQSILADITKILGSENNYRNYRTLLGKSEAPANPYLGVLLRDLTFIEDGNKDFVEDDRFVNFEKLKMVSGVLSIIARFQKVTYNYEEVPVIRDYLRDAMFLDDAALHKYSCLCEPSSNVAAAASGFGTDTGVIGKTKRSSLGIFSSTSNG